MINNNELMQIEFWQDADRITNYCYSILNYVVKNNENINITVNLQNKEALVRNIDDTSFQIYLPTIDFNASENIKKEIYMRAYFLRHELAHVIYSRELSGIGYEMLKQKHISLQHFNYLEDIRIEKKFSKQFKGTITGFKTLRYIHFAQNAALNILKYKSVENFLAYIIYRSYGFNFNLKHELLDLYESAFQKIYDRLNDTSVVNYIEITEILINIYKQNEDAISRIHKASIEQNAVISKQDVNDLDIDMIQAIAPNVLELLNNEQTIYDEKNEDEYDENNATKTIQNLDISDNEIAKNYDDNDNCQNITSNDDMVIEPASGHIKIANNKPNLELLNNFKNVVDEEVDNASFAFIKTAKVIDLQELLDNFTIKRKKMPFDSNNPILLNKYNAIVNKNSNKQAILRLSLFLKQKAQNKIVRKIMPHQLDGDVDETNITDIFVSHEPRIFKKESYLYNKDNNIIILVDFSGSMFTTNRIQSAIETLIQIYEASQIANNFNIQIYGFSSIYLNFKAKSKTNAKRFANKYNLNLSTTIKNNKQVNIVTIGGPILWKVLDTKTMRGINDSIAKKKFLANLYEATAYKKISIYDAVEKYLFGEIAGDTPEVVCMSSLYRILKNNINTNILFILNDGKFSDGNEIYSQSQSIDLLSDNNYQTFVYYPNLINDLFDLHEKYNLTIFNFNVNNALFDFLAPEVYKEIASSAKYEIVTSQTNNIWKKAANEFCVFFNKMNSMLNNEQNYKQVTLEQALQIFSIDELTQYHVIDLNKKHVVFLTEHDFEIDNNKFRLYGTLLKAPDKKNENKIINLILFKLVKLNNNMEIAQDFKTDLFSHFLRDLLYKARNNLLYLIYGAMIKNIGCKAITIGIDSAIGAKYNNNFIYINNAADAGFVIAKQLKEML